MLLQSRQYINILRYQFGKFNNKMTPKIQQQTQNQQTTFNKNKDWKDVEHPLANSMKSIAEIQKIVKDNKVQQELTKLKIQNTHEHVFMSILQYDVDECMKWLQENYQGNHKCIVLCLYRLVDKSDKHRLNKLVDSLNSKKISLQWEDNAGFSHVSQKIHELGLPLFIKYLNVTNVTQKNILVLSNIIKKIWEENMNSENMEDLVFKLLQKMPDILLSHFVENPNSILFTIIQKLYLGSQTNPKFYQLFRHIQTKKLDSFYIQVLSMLQKYRLEHDRPPFKVNQLLFDMYEESFKTQKIQLCLVCIAIAFSNNYLDIPDHFLSHNNKVFQISEVLISRIRWQLQMKKVMMGKKETIQYNKGAIKKKIEKIQHNIASNNYEKAHKIFEEQLLKPKAIQKERKLLDFVLTDFIESYADQDQIFALKNEEKPQFLDKLSQDYLWQSYKNRQGFQEIVQNYVPEDKYSFWDQAFKLKRAQQVFKLQKTNELQKYKNSDSDTIRQGQFSLPEYLRNQYEESGRSLAKQVYKKKEELKLFEYKIRLGLSRAKRSGDEFGYEQILKAHQHLCDQNIELVQQFGVKQYDIMSYDKSQLQERMKKLMMFQGNFKINHSLYNQWPSLNEQFQKFSQEIQRKPQQRKNKKKQKVDASQEGQAIEGRAEEGVEGEEVVQEGDNQQQVQVQASQQSAVQEQVVQQEQQQASQNNQQTQQPQQQGQEQVAPLRAQQKLQAMDKVKLDKDLLQILRMKKLSIFKKGSLVVKIQKSQYVEELISWGVLNQQPLAIYMGQKLANITGQIIPHNLARHVSKLFSHKAILSQQWINKCKDSLRHVGKIQRQYIYDFNRQYEHIPYRSHFAGMISNQHPEIQERIQFLGMHAFKQMETNEEPAELLNKAMKNPILY